jgi:hypothetical protein
MNRSLVLGCPTHVRVVMERFYRNRVADFVVVGIDVGIDDTVLTASCQKLHVARGQARGTVAPCSSGVWGFLIRVRLQVSARRWQAQAHTSLHQSFTFSHHHTRA